VKGEKWARLGINVHDHFKPVYVVSSDRKKIVAELKAALKQVDELYLATDEDREGRPLPGTSKKCSTPRCPSSAWSFTRSRPPPSPRRSARPGTSTCVSSTPRRAAASSTASSATKSLPYSGARSTRPIGRPCPVGRDSTGV